MLSPLFLLPLLSIAAGGCWEVMGGGVDVFLCVGMGPLVLVLLGVVCDQLDKEKSCRRDQRRVIRQFLDLLTYLTKSISG